ncbi:reverse transcriptase domain-containing protein [Tanacetum coccineum]|uniref:Reverse transcriptase domain-containing protein n=1 Tax=Tanacetum coccineum TaxID=301880 RepID=A0ABQ5I711_9ASTR
MGSDESFASVPKPSMHKKLNFRPFVNEEKVDNSDIVLPRDAIDKLMKNDDGVFLFKFTDNMGMEQVLGRGPWLIHNTLLIINQWTMTLPLKKDEVTKIPVWVKFHKVPVVAYSEDGLTLIATQVGKPLMLDAFTSSMCDEPWGHISFAWALVEINSGMELKKEVIMAILNEDGTSHTMVAISVEYEWQPLRCTDCKIFCHSLDKCPNIIRKPVISISTDTNSDGFTKVKSKQHKGKKKTGTIRKGADMDSTTKVGANVINKVKGPSTSNSFDALNNLDVDDECGTSSSKGNKKEEQEAGPKVSQLNEHFEFDDEVDEFLFPEGDKFGDKFDIRLKGRIRK